MLVGLEVVVGFALRSKGRTGAERFRPGRVTLLLKLRVLEASTYTKVRTKVRWKFGL